MEEGEPGRIERKADEVMGSRYKIQALFSTGKYMSKRPVAKTQMDEIASPR